VGRVGGGSFSWPSPPTTSARAVRNASRGDSAVHQKESDPKESRYNYDSPAPDHEADEYDERDHLASMAERIG
jgi:hypothetical protein